MRGSPSVRGGDSEMPPEQSSESGHCVHVFSVLGCACASSLHTALSSADQIFMTHLFPSQALFHVRNSREQDLLLEGRFGDPLLNSGLVSCIMLE